MNPTISNLPLRNLPTSFSGGDPAAGPSDANQRVQKVIPVRAPSATKIVINPTKVQVPTITPSAGVVVIPANPNRVSIIIRNTYPYVNIWVGGGQDQRPVPGEHKGLEIRAYESLTLETTDEISLKGDAAGGEVSYMEFVAPVPQP